MTKYTKLAFFIAGTVFGSAGFKLLSSRDAKKAYAHTTAAVLRAKECVMDTAASVQENAADILAEAKEINAARQPVCEEGEDIAEETRKAEEDYEEKDL